ncbi:MAG: hypothetical protein Ta2A_10300 [Treponemataceae bacterium]|nr:MAG: hypothetical protein Ta2A_10300 [Treponemataceae bacterium]
MENKFELNLINIHWLTAKSSSDDLCAHGKVFVKIGDEIISDDNSGDWTVTVTGLYLLRSIETDYKPFMYGNYLLPCCGFNFWMDETDKVFLLGCNSGIDFSIEHIANNLIKIISKNNVAILIHKKEFIDIVLEFVSKIESFYKNNQRRKPDRENKKGYKSFWEEWYKLKGNTENE